MKNILINIDSVDHVWVSDKNISTTYKWFDEKRFLGIVTKKRGWYWKVWRSWELSCVEIPIDYLLIDNILYRKPKVVITFANKDYITERFNTYKEARAWAMENFKHTKLLNLINAHHE